LLYDSEILLTRTAAGTAVTAAVVTFDILSLNEVDSGAGLTEGSGQEVREE
jgi:hypothetical protein